MAEDFNGKHKPRELAVHHLSSQTRGEQSNRALQFFFFSRFQLFGRSVTHVKLKQEDLTVF